MKKLFTVFLLITILFTLSSCDTWEDISQDEVNSLVATKYNETMKNMELENYSYNINSKDSVIEVMCSKDKDEFLYKHITPDYEETFYQGMLYVYDKKANTKTKKNFTFESLGTYEIAKEMNELTISLYNEKYVQSSSGWEFTPFGDRFITIELNSDILHKEEVLNEYSKISLELTLSIKNELKDYAISLVDDENNWKYFTFNGDTFIYTIQVRNKNEYVEVNP